MNLAKRIIPCLDVKGGRVVKGKHFLNLKDAGDPVETGAQYSREGADELVYLDITATIEARKTLIQLVEKTAREVFIPLTVGGGINSIEDINLLLKAGSDKVSINSAAVKNPKLITESAEKFGSQCIVVAIDAKRRTIDKPEIRNEKLKNKWDVYVNAGKKRTDKDALEWAIEAEKLGAGEILLTSMDADGTNDGYDIEITKAISDAVDIPVIASGGAGKPEHLYEVLTKGKADAALAASIFHYGKYPIKETKEYLKNKGIPIRL